MATTLHETTIEAIEAALTQQRFETARRLAAAAMLRGGGDDVRLLLHEALRRLGDIAAANRVVLASASLAETCRGQMLLAEDSFLLTRNNAYRTSDEKAQGYTLEEYEEKHNRLADEAFTRAEALAQTDADRRGLADVLRRCDRAEAAERVWAEEPPAADAPAPRGVGGVRGRLWDAEGSPVTHAKVTLGLPAEQSYADPATYLSQAMHYGEVRIDRPQAITTQTDDDGVYCFHEVPAGRCTFLSVTLPTETHAVHTRFFAQAFEVQADQTSVLNSEIVPWESAPPTPVSSPFERSRNVEQTPMSLVHEERLANPFYFDFPRQPLWFTLPDGVAASPERLRLFCSESPDSPVPFQIAGDQVYFMAELPGLDDADQTDVQRAYALYEAAAPVGAVDEGDDWLTHHGPGVVELDTGVAAFRLPLGEGTCAAAPLQGVRGPDGVWRGEGRWALPEGVSVASWRSECLTRGPVFCEVRMSFQLSTGDTLAWQVRAYRGEQTLLVREVSAAIEGAAFEFSLREFSGGRGFLHWTPENGSAHWSDLTAEDREHARLQESIAWWIPPCGFAYAMTAGGLESQDYIGVMTLRRGEWVDRHFESICRGPGEDGRELDWPYPEMIGSTVSMITAHSRADGDQVFRFACFDGERQWGLLASSFSENDGPHKAISRTQHKHSSPRLQDFKDWRLDTADHEPRPSVVTTRTKLPELRRKKDDPRFKPYYDRMTGHGYPHGEAGRGLTALLEGDPVELWMLKQRIVAEAPIRSRMTLLGRDYSDMYSPVGARPITPWVENYDLIAATGVFSAAEERLCRAFFMLMGHLYTQEDLMNWRYGSRNANFEADRVDVVGAVGLAFRGNPDADAMVRHAADLMESSLNTYCTPGSGKWYENPACYYLHASSCRLNLAWHLYSHGILDSTTIPRLKDFLSWGPNLLTPRLPISDDLLRDGCDDAGYQAATKVRRIPPIGDHAHLGQWVGEFNALMAQAYAAKDPDFANDLRWAYDQGGREGGHFNNYPLYFVHVGEDDLKQPEPVVQPSRRLEGFGSVFRGKQNTPEEFYCLFKLGPGGYRYHRTEGSIILFADGKPLIYDGGEAGETWRHTTLAFGETHAPLAPGHIERFASFGGLDFAQGVNPKALTPGEPVFLSDSCEHMLVEEAHRRFNEPNPANSRTCMWVKDAYLILHDQLNLPPGLETHWHLQAVADEQAACGEDGWRLRGRFGTDLQVILPGQRFDAVTFKQTPILEYRRKPEETFSMRHMQATTLSPDSFLAVLRPVREGGALNAQRTPIGKGGAVLSVTGDGIDDWHLLDRDGASYDADGVCCRARYASVLRRPEATTLTLVDGEHLAAEGLTLSCTGVRASVTRDHRTGELTLEAEGNGRVRVTGGRTPIAMDLSPRDGRVQLVC